MHHHTNSEFHDCITQCWSCRDTCQSTLFNYCMEQGGAHTDANHVRIMMDCLQICQTTADAMTRNSQMHAVLCSACAAICEACASSCDAMNDPEMTKCAEICRGCAESCREMANKAGLKA